MSDTGLNHGGAAGPGGARGSARGAGPLLPGRPSGRVLGVHGLDEVALVLQAPDYATGIAATRRGVMPVLDLRVRAGAAARFDRKTRLLVVALPGASDETRPDIVGFLIEAGA